MVWRLQLPDTALSELASISAAHYGHVDQLRWLTDNGCPWDAHDLCRAAAQSGSVEVLTYLQQQGLVTSPTLLTEMLDNAAGENQLAAAKWLREQGAEWPSSTAFNHRAWSGELLEWARAEDCTSPLI
jgi:hypothetical protein